MLSSVLRSKIAVHVNIQIMRAFVNIRHAVKSQPDSQLSQTLKLIQTQIDKIEATHLVDHTILTTKMTELSREVRRVSDVLDAFQDTHIVIKRPEDHSVL